MFDSLTSVSTELGISVWLLALVMVWSMVWKLAALWKSARNGALIWFIVLALINTVGILEILYIFVFSKIKALQPSKTKPLEEDKTPKKKSSKKKK